MLWTLLLGSSYKGIILFHHVTEMNKRTCIRDQLEDSAVSVPVVFLHLL